MLGLEDDLSNIMGEITDIQNKLASLANADRPDTFCPTPSAIGKLHKVASETDAMELSSSEISKAFDILRKYRYASTESNQRGASLPPGVTRYHSMYEENALERSGDGVTASLSDHSLPASRFVVYENFNNEWEIIPDDSISLDSSSTLETSLTALR